MSYSETTVLSKLSTLNETQESIVGIAHWILFHKRYALQSANIWARFLEKAPVNKKLGIIYLANEIVQQSRAKRKEEFITSFGQILPENLAKAYQATPEDTRARIRRVVNVWKQRNIFSESIIADIEQKVSLSAAPSTLQKASVSLNHAPSTGLGPTQLASVNSLGAAVYKDDALEVSADVLKLYEDIFNSDTLPEPPIYLKSLEALDSKLNQSVERIQSLITNRKKLNEDFARLLEESEADLVKEDAVLSDLQAKLSQTRETKEELKDMVEGTTAESSTELETEPEDKHQRQEEAAAVSTTEVDDGYQPEIDDSTAPAYDPMSSDEEDNSSEPPSKRAKAEPTTTVTGLDPKIAALLSNFSQKNDHEENDTDTDNTSKDEN